MIRQGDLFWVALEAGVEGGRRPYVVIQNHAVNASRIGTVMLCALTSHLARAAAPGNVPLEAGEGGLPRRSVVNVSQVYTAPKAELEEYIGTLSADRVREILAGLWLLLEPTP